jgi:predicted nucleic acid-binding protein
MEMFVWCFPQVAYRWLYLGISSFNGNTDVEYSSLVIPIDRSEAEHAALFRVHAKQQGRVIHLADSFIAGTAKAHDLSLVTRNADDFFGIDIDIVNPWNKE